MHFLIFLIPISLAQKAAIGLFRWMMGGGGGENFEKQNGERKQSHNQTEQGD